ncbi:recombinase RecT [Bartonella sp. DGB1]|uniref:recombinase RecT n=1 Tax=Bartonella sp. DGB1 TaxID=3239807 RepID=UPI0035252B27
MTHSPLALMAQKYNFSPEKFKETVVKTCMSGDPKPEEFHAFISVANEYGLNPLTKEIYAFPKRGGGIMPIVSVDGWVKIIHSNNKFDGLQFRDNLDENGKLISITCCIKLANVTMPIEVTEYLSECMQNSDTWKKYPSRMLRHKALIQCARYAFGYSGIFDEDEAHRINQPVLEVTTIDIEKIQQIKNLLKTTAIDENTILEHFNIASLEELTETQAEIALKKLQKSQKKLTKDNNSYLEYKDATE